MARIGEVAGSAIPEELRPLYARFTGEYGDFTNQARVVAHSPAAFAHLYGLIDAWRRDGRPLADFAAHIGCEYERLRRWTKRVEPAPQFIELRAAAPAQPIEVVVGEVTIRVPPGFDASTLRQLLKVLTAC